MKDSDPLQTIFQFALIIGGICLLILRATGLLPTFANVLRWILIVLGIFYAVYKGLNMENKLKRNLYIIGALLTVLLIIGLNFLFYMGECSLNKPCPEDLFCANDHVCHSFPEYTNKVTKVKINETIDFTLGGAIVGIGLIISAIILRKTPFYDKIKKTLTGAKNIVKRLFR